MGAYTEFEQRRLERMERRRQRHEREAQKDDALARWWQFAQVAILAVLLYGMLFVGCLWAAA